MAVENLESRVRAIVIFNTRFGSTEKIAKSIELGLRRAGIQAASINSKEANLQSLERYDLICVGAPTEVFSASKQIKKFLTKLKKLNLSGKHSFAFDTRIESRLSGSGCKYIEKELRNLGLFPVIACESAIVSTVREKGQFSGSILKEEEEKRFEEIGLRLGNNMLKAKEVISA